MANTLPIFQSGPSNGTPQTILPADTTAEKTIYTAGSDGALVDSVFVTSDDTSDVVLNVFINNGTTSFLIGAVTIPTLSGTDGTAPTINLLNLASLPALQAGGGLTLQPTHKLNVSAQSAVTTAKTVTITAAGGDY